ncbi:Appr-1-p processing protein (plasmid) [Streptomyces sp. BI20]|uniref:Appr-1-p processing protein n=1 Tax=Streptomyces sp. BI20 TaxID=3403460 RepID=UPI003C78C26A
MRHTHGDATHPQGPGPKIVAHLCNDTGGWGKGFVVAVSRRWPEPERAYRRWYRARADNDFALGAVQLVPVETEITLANLIGQHGIARAGAARVPIRYDAVARALDTLAEHATALGASVHMPRIGCGLAGGHWSRVGPLVDAALTARGVPVTVYDPSPAPLLTARGPRA